ncbi:MAG: acetate/propionate family kinase [Planctomycetaceae bacterium]|nr:acetate/propionate family kinase [Planctomycetaceae bacterium]
MNILALNAGSSSLTYKLFSSTEAGAIVPLAWGKAHRVGVVSCTPSFLEHQLKDKDAATKHIVPIQDHADAFTRILSWLARHNLPIDAVAHRFVHGGQHFSRATLIDKDVLALLRECMVLAPLHNPVSIKMIDLALERLPGIPQAAAFDTAFHASLPDEATHYAIPLELTREYGLKRTGFHGLSYQAVMRELEHHWPSYRKDMRVVACHLGTGGASMAAIKNGQSVGTSMGCSTYAGLVMSTRCGDLDPGVVLALLSQLKCTPKDLQRMLTRDSGLLGLSGLSSDIRDLLPRLREDPTSRAGLACRVYLHRLKHFLGAFLALLGGLDMLVFTDTVGLTVPELRAALCQNMEWCGMHLDPDKNKSVSGNGIAEVHARQSAIQILVVPNDEELEIARQAAQLFGAA